MFQTCLYLLNNTKRPYVWHLLRKTSIRFFFFFTFSSLFQRFIAENVIFTIFQCKMTNIPSYLNKTKKENKNKNKLQLCSQTFQKVQMSSKILLKHSNHQSSPPPSTLSSLHHLNHQTPPPFKPSHIYLQSWFRWWREASQPVQIAGMQWESRYSSYSMWVSFELDDSKLRAYL